MMPKVSLGPWAAALTATLATSLSVYEGQRLKPYPDIGGTWTVCEGVTGSAVVPGRRYTEATCLALLQSAVIARLDGVEALCAPQLTQLPRRVQFALGHLAYNVGASAVCQRKNGGPSMIASRLAAGDIPGVCAAITRYTRVKGKDCRDPKNHCTGILRRRAFEAGVCQGSIAVKGLDP